MKSIKEGIVIPPVIRIIIIVTIVIAACTRFIQGNETWFLYLAAACLFTYEHYKGGTIGLAFQAYRKQDIEKVRKYVNATAKPEWLRPSSKAYYYFLRGVIATVDKNLEQAKEMFLQSLNYPFRTSHLKCITYCLLADTSLRLAEYDDAKEFFSQAQTIPHRDEIQPMFDDLEKQIAKE